MKVLSIGRDDSCNIVIDDPEKLISRKHALLKLYGTGKMEIVDMSTNGTFVNGLAVPKNKPYVVTRKDVVSFARVRQLDWSLVPNNLRMVKIGALVLCAVVVLLAAVILWPSKKNSDIGIEPDSQQMMKPDSVKSKKEKNEDGDTLSYEDIKNAFRQADRKKHAADKKKKASDSLEKKKEEKKAGDEQKKKEDSKGNPKDYAIL